MVLFLIVRLAPCCSLRVHTLRGPKSIKPKNISSLGNWHTLEPSQELQWYPGVFISFRKQYLFPPFLKMIFFPLSWHAVFRLLSWPFCFNSFLFCTYFTLSHPLLFSSVPFLPFSFTISLFLSFPCHIFPPNDIGWYFPHLGVGVFSNV
jgi:hypothetical protein